MKDQQTSQSSLYFWGRIVRVLVLLAATFSVYLMAVLMLPNQPSTLVTAVLGTLIIWFSLALGASVISVRRRLHEPWRLIQDSVLVLMGCSTAWVLGTRLLFSKFDGIILGSIFDSLAHPITIGDWRWMTPMIVLILWMKVVALTVLFTRCFWYRNERPMESASRAIIKGGWIFASGMFGILVAGQVLSGLSLGPGYRGSVSPIPMGPFWTVTVLSGLSAYLLGHVFNQGVRRLTEKQPMNSFFPFSVVMSAGKRSVTLGWPPQSNRDSEDRRDD